VPAQHLLGVLGGPVEVVDGEGDLELGVAVRLAGLAMHHLGELGHAPGDDALPLQEQLFAPLEAESLPPGDLAAGPSHRGVDLLRGADGVGADDVAVGRVERVERLGRRGPGDAVED
jgi:hypothetical protein